MKLRMSVSSGSGSSSRPLLPLLVNLRLSGLFVWSSVAYVGSGTFMPFPTVSLRFRLVSLINPFPSMALSAQHSVATLDSLNVLV